MTRRERVIRRAVATLETIDRETAKVVAADLRTLLPKRRPVPQHRKERAERTATRRDEDAGVRTAVMARADGACEACHVPVSSFTVTKAPLELDHFFGRARDRSMRGCWALCRNCHAEKTFNHPSRLWWLERFEIHARRLGYGEVLGKVAALIDKYRGQHPSGAKPLESAK